MRKCLISLSFWTGSGNTDSTANILFAGASLGMSWKVADGVRLMPEVAAATPIVQSLSSFGSSVGVGGLALQAGVGVALGD